LADEWENHGKSILSDIEKYVYHPLNYFLLAKYFAINWQKAIDKYVAKPQSDGKFLVSFSINAN
jgi:hypothetical protein